MTPKLPAENARGDVPIGRRELAALRAFSTAAICDAIADLAPERRGAGFTTAPLVAVRPDLPPIVGYACTATVRTVACADPASEHSGWTAWIEHLERARKPTIAVVQDLDRLSHSHAACWDHVLAAVHAALGGEGIVTNGAVRNTDLLPPAFQVLADGSRPSRGGLRFTSVGATVTVAGLAVPDGAIVHADRNGAVIVPDDLVREIPAAIEHARAHDAALLAACRRPDVSFNILQPLLGGQRQTRWCS